MKPLLVIAMTGLGDSIYQRGYVRDLSGRFDVYLSNSWPQLYADLPVRFVQHELKLRTQEKNVRSLPPETWATLPQRIRRQYLGYSLTNPKDNILTDLDRLAPLTAPLVFDLPPLPPCPIQADRPIAVIRPVTVRGEWMNQSAELRSRYVAEAAGILRAQGFFVVSVADLQRGIENALAPLPPADLYYHKGELGVMELLSLVAHAAIVVGPIGWILPASIAARTPAIMIGGGHGAYNRPARLVDPRLDTSRLRWVMPHPFCMCANMLHGCNKRIPGFAARFVRAMGAVIERQAVAA